MVSPKSPLAKQLPVAAKIAQLGVSYTEDLKVPCSIPGFSRYPVSFTFVRGGQRPKFTGIQPHCLSASPQPQRYLPHRRPLKQQCWFHGVMVSSLDFEFSDLSSNLGGTCEFLRPFLVLLPQYICVWIHVLRRLPLDPVLRRLPVVLLFSAMRLCRQARWSRAVVLNLFFHWAALWSKCKSHGPHACHLHITSSIQTNQIYNIIYSLNIMICKRSAGETSCFLRYSQSTTLQCNR